MDSDETSGLLDKLIGALANLLDGEILEAADHVVACELDAAYTRNVTERFDGLTHPPDHDGVATLVDVWGNSVMGLVDLTIPDAGIRLNLDDEQAEKLGCALLAEAARIRREVPFDLGDWAGGAA